jgi:hypothetical protein
VADLDFTINADTSRARNNLDQLERRVGSVGSAFGKLKGAIGGLVAAASIKGLFAMSNALADLSATTNVSIQSIAGLGEALAQNSGSFDQANGAILRFTETLGNAVEGNDKTREAFARIGVTLEDLQNLSEQDILRKTILGLGQITDVGIRATLTADLFAKSLRGADLAGVARDLDRITDSQERFAGAAAVAGEVNQSLQNSFRELQQQLLVALKPFAEFLSEILKSKQAISDFIDTALRLLAVLGSLFIIGKLIAPLAGLALAAAGAGKGLGGVALAASGLTIVISKAKDVWYLLSSAVIGVKNAMGSAALASKIFGGALAFVLQGFSKLIPILGIAFTAFEVLNFGLKRFFDFDLKKWFADAAQAVTDFIGITSKAEREAAALQEQWNRAELDKLKRLSAEQQQNAQRQLAESEKAKKAAEDRRKEEERIAEAFKNQLQSLRDSVDLYARGNEDAQRRLRQEIELIGLTEEQKTMKQALFDVEENYLREVTRLTDLYAEKSRSSKEEDRRLLPEIQTALQNVTAEYERQLAPVMALTQEKLQTLNVEKQRLEIEKQLQNFSEFATRSRLDGERKIRDIQREIAMSTMTDIQRKYADIAIAAEESARSAIEAENARRKAINQPLLTSDEQQKYYEAANQGTAELIRQTQEHHEMSRTWSFGWKSAFKDYIENATNAAQQAQRIFERTTKGMEDAIVNFAKTGKFEFKNFVNMILEELLRIQIQRTFANLFGAGSGGNQTSVIGSMGKLLGFANGGIIPTDRPVLVGERGPELLVGASGNRVIANDQLTGTNVTYNINAVDASSFKEMLARDPSFLYAVTEQGRRRAPGTRR